MKYSLNKLYNDNKCPFGSFSLEEKNVINRIGPKGNIGEQGIKGERGVDADPCLKFRPDDRVTDIKCINKIFKETGCKGKIILSNETKKDTENKILYVKGDNIPKYTKMKYSLNKLYNDNKCPFGSFSLEEKNVINRIGPKGNIGKQGIKGIQGIKVYKEKGEKGEKGVRMQILVLNLVLMIRLQI